MLSIQNLRTQRIFDHKSQTTCRTQHIYHIGSELRMTIPEDTLPIGAYGPLERSGHPDFGVPGREQQSACDFEGLQTTTIGFI